MRISDWSSDVCSSDLIIAASLATWSGMTALSGLATGFGSLVAFRIGVALGEAGSVPASHSIIADYYPPEKRVTALALWGLALSAGIMLGYASGGWIAAALGWRDRKSTLLNSRH